MLACGPRLTLQVALRGVGRAEGGRQEQGVLQENSATETQGSQEERRETSPIASAARKVASKRLLPNGRLDVPKKGTLEARC